MKMNRLARLGAVGLALAAFSSAAVAQRGGQGGTQIQGAAGGANAQGAGEVEYCEQTLGTLAIDDGREKTWYYEWSTRTQVTSVEPMIRLIAQQSNCFIVTSVGNERLDSRISGITQQQRNSGEFREGSNQQAGQRVAADYYLEPTIMFSQAGTGALGGAIGSRIGGVLGGVVGGMKTSSTQVNLSLFDIRSGIQLSASEGSSSSRDIGLGGLLGGGGTGGALGGYTKTPEGRATVAAFVDAYNSMVVALKNYKAQSVEGGSGTGGVLQVN
ncbi:hypothetical protein GC169_11560 [bacterium]|nr:hypothetical protein [bacterium]